MSDTEQNSDTPSPQKRISVLRPARRDELDLTHQRLMEAIEASPFYNDTFKTFEKSRLTKDYLLRLHEEDPAHIMMVTDKDEPIGFMISGPEYGALFLYWSYAFPEKRRGTAAIRSMREFVEYWDHGRFHKISTFTKQDNKVAAALMKRHGYELTATLENHLFGEDYCLYEHKLTKVTPDYDTGLSSIGRLGRLKRGVKALFGLKPA